LEEITAKMNKNTLTIASGTNVGQHIWYGHTLSVDDIHIMFILKSSSQSVRWPLRCIQVSKDHESNKIPPQKTNKMSNTENQKLGGVPLSYLTLDTRRSIVKSSTSLLEGKGKN
jgi:hypothetical protein